MQNYKSSPNSSTETPLKKVVSEIDKKFPKSAILQYYLGFYYDEIHNTELAIRKLAKCISLLPFFSQPYLHLANIYINNNQHEQALKILQEIFKKRTVDMKSGSLKRTINLPDQMQIGVMLQSIHEKMGDNEKVFNCTTCNAPSPNYL
jgi:tetratricopeptide (TPR) repeat protein